MRPPVQGGSSTLAGPALARARARRSRGVRRAIVAVIVTINALVVVGLWLHDGGITGAHNTAELLTTLGRITGLLGAYLLLLQVLLLARIHWLEQTAGFDRMTVWHRINGKVCFYLILAHVILITGGYAMSDNFSIAREVSTLLSQYPGIPDAAVGTGLLIFVVVTSFVVVRHWLRYDLWYLIHLTAYAALILAWFHQLPTGNDFLLNPAAAAYWTALYLVTLALVLLFRLALPIIYAFRYQLKVAEVNVEGSSVVSLRLTGRRLDRIRARAGQFFLWRFLTPRLVWESPPFSLSAAPDNQSLRVTVKSLGGFSSRIALVVAAAAAVAARFVWIAAHSTSANSTAAIPTVQPTSLGAAVPAATGTSTLKSTHAAQGAAPAVAKTSASKPTTPPAAIQYAGSVVNATYGPIQVTISVKAGKITAVNVWATPRTSRSQLLEAQALPTLKKETLQAQSANINTVSGATGVSNAYIQSLRSALTKAHLS